jgi:hypothetical protein
VHKCVEDKKTKKRRIKCTQKRLFFVKQMTMIHIE